VAELEAALREIHLPVNGLKAVLQRRLQDAYNKNDGTSPEEGTDVINVDGVLNENELARVEQEAVEDMYGCE
jgi:hypothetical protein